MSLLILKDHVKNLRKVSDEGVYRFLDAKGKRFVEDKDTLDVKIVDENGSFFVVWGCGTGRTELTEIVLDYFVIRVGDIND